jgi:hypothetical protein
MGELMAITALHDVKLALFAAGPKGAVVGV